MHRIDSKLKERIINLRLIGKSIPEIARITGAAKTTIQRTVFNVIVPEEYRAALKLKQGGSNKRAKALRDHSLLIANERLGEITERDCLFLLIGLYWGEGTKRDFGIINSDPKLIETFIACLLGLGIKRSRLSASIRIHSNISISESKKFWSKLTKITIKQITQVEIIEGKKNGKLPYGMCRIRVKKGIRERLLIQSMISTIGKDVPYKLLSGNALVV